MTQYSNKPVCVYIGICQILSLANNINICLSYHTITITVCGLNETEFECKCEEHHFWPSEPAGPIRCVMALWEALVDVFKLSLQRVHSAREVIY